MKRPQVIKSEMDIWKGSEGMTRHMILSQLIKKPLKMIELQNKLSNVIKSRGALRYHLNILKKYDYILPLERKSNEYGRPTYIKINSVKRAIFKKKFESKMKREQQEIFNEYAQNPLTKKILKLIEENPNKDFKELLNKMEIKNYPLKFQITDWLHRQKYIKEALKITKEGLKFLKEHSK